MRYPLSKNPVFFSFQGEGHLRGFRMTFVRLGGCNVGCAQCDTDYAPESSATAEEIAARVTAATPKMKDPWAWITGGEPAMFNLRPLIGALRGAGLSVAVATSGQERVIPPVDWLSVSPHRMDFKQRYGDEIKLVDGLNGLALEEPENTDFFYRYVQPISANGKEDSISLLRCQRWLADRPNWSLSRQDHLYWGVP